jgi:hypothetical protein
LHPVGADADQRVWSGFAPAKLSRVISKGAAYSFRGPRFGEGAANNLLNNYLDNALTFERRKMTPALKPN